MALNGKALGRGIDALLSGEAETETSSVVMTPITSIIPNPHQPRKRFDEESIEDLAASITAHGILQPLLVRPNGKPGEYQLVAGERRLRAAQRAGLREVPVYARKMSENEAMIVALLENLQREDLNAIEEARGIEALKTAMNATMDQLAEILGQPRGTLSNTLRLLKLAPSIQEDVINGRISPTHAKALASAPEGPKLDKLRERVLAGNINTRETEEAVAFLNEHGHLPWEEATEADMQAVKPRRMPRQADPNMLRLANSIGATLNCRAKISGNQNKGRISISYDTNEQLFDLLEKLGLSLQP